MHKAEWSAILEMRDWHANWLVVRHEQICPVLLRNAVSHTWASTDNIDQKVYNIGYIQAISACSAGRDKLPDKEYGNIEQK